MAYFVVDFGAWSKGKHWDASENWMLLFHLQDILHNAGLKPCIGGCEGDGPVLHWAIDLNARATP